MSRSHRHRVVTVAIVLLAVTAATISISGSAPPSMPTDSEPFLVDRMPAVASNRPLVDPVRDEVAAAGTVVVREYIDVTEDEIRLLDAETPGFLDQVILLGWQRDGNRFSRELPARGIELRRGADEPIRIRDSRFAVVLGRDDRSGRDALSRDDAPFNVTFEGVQLPHAEIEFKRTSPATRPGTPLTMNVVVNVNYRDSKTAMCHIDEHSAGGRQVKAEAMEEARCLDYNGPYSDGINYKASDIRAWRNAIHSDCDYALGAGHCWTEHITKKSCSSTHGNQVCSALIGHSSTYHKHRS